MSCICARSLLMITAAVRVAQNHCMAQRIFWLFTDFQGWTGPLWTVWPLTNCHYFTNSSELTSFFKCVTISHQFCGCLALQPTTTKGFHCNRVKGYQVYFTFWSFSSPLPSVKETEHASVRPVWWLSLHSLIWQWNGPENPYLCLFTEEPARGLARGGQWDALCSFP